MTPATLLLLICALLSLGAALRGRASRPAHARRSSARAPAITEGDRIDATLRFIAEAGSEGDFPAALARHLGEVLDVGYVVIFRINQAQGMAESVAFHAPAGMARSVRCMLSATPLSAVDGEQVCCHATGARALFPAFELLAEAQAESCAAIPLRDSKGRAIGLIAVLDRQPIRDEAALIRTLRVAAPRAAAELERAESDRRLRAREQQFRILAENMPDSLARWDLEGRILYSNPAYRRTLGVARNLTGRRHAELLPELGMLPVDRAIARIIATGEGPALVQQPLAAAGGEPRILEFRLVPEFDDGGALISVLGIGRDITERTIAERRLKEAIEFSEGIINAIPDLLFELDRHGRYLNVWAQTPELLAAQRTALVGRTVYDVLSRENAEAAMAALREADEKGLAFGKVIRIDLPQGAKWFEHSLSRRPGRTPAEATFLVLSRDITERKVSEEAREQALQETMRLVHSREAFVSQVSHELRTPLNAVLGYAQLLQERPGVSEEMRADLKVIERSGEHLLSLINDILDHAKLEANRLVLEEGPIKLAEFLSGIVAIIRVKVDEKRLAFTWRLDPELPGVVRGDEKRLRQVLLNLLANAVKFTDEGRVGLRLWSPAPGWLRFEVEDSGAGIEPGELENIFLPFEQAGSARSRAGGTGLGLAISRRLARLMGGDIRVESQVGEGSRFLFDLRAEAVASESPVEAPLGTRAGLCGATAAARPEAPPERELRGLFDLAERGNMRRIIERAEALPRLDRRYQPFADELKRMAEGFRSKAVLEFVKHYLENA